MNFTVSSSLLLKKLQIIGGVIASNNTMPILDNFLFKLSGNKLVVYGSNMATTIKGTIDVESQAEASLAVPSKILIDILKTFSEQNLVFEIAPNNIINITSTSGQYNIGCVGAEDYPLPVEIEDKHSIQISGDVLSSAIQSTIFAASDDDQYKAVISSVFFNITPQGATFVATDSHKLVKYHRLDVTSTEDVSFIIPKKTLSLLKNVVSSSDVFVFYNQNNAKFVFDDIEVICQLVDGKYPDYNNVIPKNNPNKLTIERLPFISSIKRVSLFASKEAHLIKLNLSPTHINIYAQDTEYNNKATEQVPCQYLGDPMEIGFNSKFLLEVLGNLSSDNIFLDMATNNRACLLTPSDGQTPEEDISMVIMPLLIDSDN